MAAEDEKIQIRCDCYAEHVRWLGDLDKAVDKNTNNHAIIWDEIRKRVTLSLFVIFVALTVGGFGSLFGFLWHMNSTLNEKLTTVVSEIAVLNERTRGDFDDH